MSWCGPGSGPHPTTAIAAGSQPGPRDAGAVLGVPGPGRTGGVRRRQPTPGCRFGRCACGPAACAGTRSAAVTGDLSQWPPRLGVARRERWGRPDRNRVPGATGPALSTRETVPGPAAGGAGSGRSRGPVGMPGSEPSGVDQGGRPTACSDCSTPPTSTSAPATRTSATPRRPSASASSPRSGRAWTSPSRRRWTCSWSPATCSTPTSSRAGPWSEWRRSSPASRRPGSATVLIPGHPRRLRPLVRLPRLRPAPRSPARGPAEDLVTVLTPDRPWIHLARARRRRPRARVRHEARAAQPAAGPRRRRRRRDGHLEDRPAARRDRDPRAHGPRRGRRSPRTRSRPAASTTSRSGTGTRRRSRRRGT